MNSFRAVAVIDLGALVLNAAIVGWRLVAGDQVWTIVNLVATVIIGLVLGFHIGNHRSTTAWQDLAEGWEQQSDLWYRRYLGAVEALDRRSTDE